MDLWCTIWMKIWKRKLRTLIQFSENIYFLYPPQGVCLLSLEREKAYFCTRTRAIKQFNHNEYKSHSYGAILPRPKAPRPSSQSLSLFRPLDPLASATFRVRFFFFFFFFDYLRGDTDSEYSIPTRMPITRWIYETEEKHVKISYIRKLPASIACIYHLYQHLAWAHVALCTSVCRLCRLFAIMRGLHRPEHRRSSNIASERGQTDLRTDRQTFSLAFVRSHDHSLYSSSSFVAVYIRVFVSLSTHTHTNQVLPNHRPLRRRRSPSFNKHHKRYGG